MIELVSEDRCTGCDLCVQVCPTHVFDAVPGGIPVIARKHDCQTCFMCEAWCPVDALYVAPFAEEEKVVEVMRGQPRSTRKLWSTTVPRVPGAQPIVRR